MNPLAEVPTADLIAELFRRSEVGLFAVLVGNADAAQAVPTPPDLAPCWVAIHAHDGKRDRLNSCVYQALKLLRG